MKLSTRELAILAVFGTLWGIVEISLGSALKSLNVPLSGAVLSAIGLTVALIGRVFVPRRGATLFVGVIAMLLKLFSLGGVILGPMVGILTEALVAEIVLSLFGKPRRWVFLLAGGLGVTWVLLQPFITGPLLFGRTLLVVWLDLLDLGHRLLRLNPNTALWIVLALVAIHLAVGGLVGWLSWDFAHQLQIRLGKPLPSALNTNS
jgi:ABC-type thiamin/hydroxymethylpyrimidine transport system permease subunit